MRSIRILVVEADPISQRVAQLALEQQGYEVTAARTGKPALALYEQNPYDLILMDMGLPDMQGTDITRKMRAIEQVQGNYTPIIALTAHGTLAKRECLAAGMDDFTSKPLDMERLHQLIKRWIAKFN